jgi:hypothetical protein
MLVESFNNLAIVATRDGSVSESDRKVANNSLLVFLLVVTLFIVLQFIIGPWLWNNVLIRLIPAFKLAKAEWYDIFLLNLILTLVLPTFVR